MKKLGLLIILALLVGAIPVVAAYPECGISETLVLENNTNAPATYSFTRGTHTGFVILLPGQTTTVDVVWCR